MQTGDILAGRYRIVRPLGQGGMALVFSAEDQRLLRPVAVKILPPQLRKDPAAVKRILREARAVAALNHPNIVAIFDVLEEPEVVGIVMEEVTGPSLRQLLDQDRADLATVSRIMEHTCAGVAAAHARGIIHRDLKPSNVLLTDRGVAKVVDFGVAAILDETEATATIRGSVPYVAPEQAKGGAPDARSDVYGLGCLLYELVTGQPPFTGTTMEVLGQHLHAPPPRPSQRRPDAPRGLDDVISRALAKDPADRFADATELAAATAALDLGLASTRLHGATAVLPAASVAMSAATVPVTAVDPTSRRRFGNEQTLRRLAPAALVAGVVVAVLALLAAGLPGETPSATPSSHATAAPSPEATPTPVSTPTSLEEGIEAIAAAVATAPASGDLTDDGHEKLQSRIKDLRAELRQGPPRDRADGVSEQLDKLAEDISELEEKGDVSSSFAEMLRGLTDQLRDLLPDEPRSDDDDD